MNSHLPIFTEVMGYNQDISTLGKKDGDSSEEEEEKYVRGNESDQDDVIEEPQGIKGMTLQLIELWHERITEE